MSGRGAACSTPRSPSGRWRLSSRSRSRPARPSPVPTTSTSGRRTACGSPPSPRGHVAQVAGTDASPHLDKAVEFYSWLVVISQILLVILNFFYGLFHNWGVAIILLTVLVKLVLFPLTYKQMVSAEQMKKLQPKMEAIKKKFPDDRERQNMETMKLYQEAKVNTLGDRKSV